MTARTAAPGRCARAPGMSIAAGHANATGRAAPIEADAGSRDAFKSWAEMIFIVKLIAAPVLIWALTAISRRFGPAVSGMLMGVPLITGPISLLTAHEQGVGFARDAAVANLVGQVSTCLFCLAFAVMAPRRSAWAGAAAGVAAFAAATTLWSWMTWSLWSATALLLVTIAAAPLLMRARPHEIRQIAVPRWDLPLRMAVAAIFVTTMTSLAPALGPRLTGLIAPFPTFVLILAVFTHREVGGAAAANLARGVVLGSLSFAAFFVTLGLGLTRLGLWAYAPAALASLVASALIYGFRRPAPRRSSPQPQ